MKKKRFSEEQIVKILAEAESGITLTELCRKHNVSGPTFYEWKKKYGGMSAEALTFRESASEKVAGR